MTIKSISALLSAILLVACNTSDTNAPPANNSAATANGSAPAASSSISGYAGTLTSNVDLTKFASCQYGYEDGCFYNSATNSTTRFVTQSDIVSIKNNPASIATIYPKYRVALQGKLGSAFAGINDNGLALIFAALSAYETVPYTGVNITANSDSFDLATMMQDGNSLVCDQYTSLAIQLFYLIKPQNLPGNSVIISGAGWRSDSPVENHVQLFATNTGVPIMVDPTYAIFAVGTLDGLFLGQSLPLSSNFSDRTWDDVDMAYGRTLIRDAYSTGKFNLIQSNGLYAPSPLMYGFIALDSTQTGGPKTYSLDADIINEFAPGPSNTFYYITALLDDPNTGVLGGRLWQISEQGTQLADSSQTYYSAISSRYANGTLQMLSTTGDLYETFSFSIPFQLDASNVSSIATGMSGTVTDYLASGSMYGISSNGTNLTTTGINSIVGGDAGLAVYYLSGTNLYKQTASGMALSKSGVQKIAAARGFQSQGWSTYVLTVTGVLWRIDNNGNWNQLTGTGQTLTDAILDFNVPPIGENLNVLTTKGQVLQGNFDLASVTIPVWNSPLPLQSFSSISLIEGDTILAATPSGGGAAVLADSMTQF